MSLSEVELDCDGLVSKQEERIVDTKNANFASFHCNEQKDEEIHDKQNHLNYHNLELVKQKELMQHLQDLKREYSEKVSSLEHQLDHVMRENEAYDSQIAALKQHNEYLREAQNQWHS